MADLRIHPAIGVARLGNSEQYFVGPEHPGVPANWDEAGREFKPFKDADRKILRQAARFRVFEFDASGNPRKEVTRSDGRKIEWTVHVANRKASFFTFNGQSGNETNPPYVARAKKRADEVEKQLKGPGRPERKNMRNAHVPDRRSLEIDPGPVLVSEPFRPVDLEDSKTSSPIKELGRVQMDNEGRLLFLGGMGMVKSNLDKPAAIDEYANNDGWFDDTCDGTIEAIVTFPDGHKEAARSAWVMVGPPKFAPGIQHVVTLYDLLWDIAVRVPLACTPGSDPVLQDLVAQQRAWREQTNDFAPGYEPSFVEHIYPILVRGLAARDVHEPPVGRHDYHGTLPDWPRLSQRSENKIREAVFARIRNPNSNRIDPLNMPRGLGDDFTTLDQFEEAEEEGSPSKPALSTAYLSLTKVQYALLKLWSEGKFKEDWTFGDVRFAPLPGGDAITPHGLDRAAIENCVGGPFYPGIEVSWLIRHPDLYHSAFRLKHPGSDLRNVGPLPFQAGFFSQQMALPWTADFYDCHKEDHTPEGSNEQILFMWWTANRPDDFRSSVSDPMKRWVGAFDAANTGENPNDPDDITNIARFEQMRTRWHELSFVVLEGEEHVEQKVLGPGNKAQPVSRGG